MAELRARYAAKHLFSFHQTSRVDGGDASRVYRDGFVAWWLSPRATLAPLAGAARACCGALLGFRLRLRRASRSWAATSTTVAALVERGLLNAGRLRAAVEAGTARWDGSVEVGDDAAELAESDGASSIEVEGEHVDDIAPFLAAMAIPASCGSSVCVDLAAKEDAAPADVARLRALATDFLRSHVEEDLGRLPHFYGVRVVRPVGVAGGAAGARVSVGINHWSTAGLGYLQTPLPRSNRTRFP